jgi:hypothetical protein
MSANERQVGGQHYGPGSTIQHWDWARGLPYLSGVLTKYVCRHKTSGKPNDLEKALHYAEKIEEPPKIVTLEALREVYQLTPLELEICQRAMSGDTVIDLVAELLRNPR